MNFRKFGDPPNRGDIHVPNVRRPIPRRDAPLAGTKGLDTPIDIPDGLVLKPRGLPPGVDFYPQAKALGVIAVVLAIAALLCTLINTFFDATDAFTVWLAGVAIASFFLVHIFGIISQSMSRSRNSLGLAAIVLLWGGFAAIVVIAIIRRWLSGGA